jgi:hypothetical protein
MPVDDLLLQDIQALAATKSLHEVLEDPYEDPQRRLQAAVELRWSAEEMKGYTGDIGDVAGQMPLPFARHAVRGIRSLALRGAAKRIKSGKGTGDDYWMLAGGEVSRLLEERRKQIAEGRDDGVLEYIPSPQMMGEIGAFGIEMGLTGGIPGAVAPAVSQALGGGRAAQIAGSATGLAAQTAATGLPAATIGQQLEPWIDENGDLQMQSAPSAVAAGAAKAVAEVAVEKAGEPIAKGLNKVAGKVLPKAAGEALERLGKSETTKTLNRAGYQGVPAEMAEERAMELIGGGLDTAMGDPRADFGATGDIASGDPKRRQEGFKQLRDEAVAFGALGVGGGAAGLGEGRQRKQRLADLHAQREAQAKEFEKFTKPDNVQTLIDSMFVAGQDTTALEQLAEKPHATRADFEALGLPPVPTQVRQEFLKNLKAAMKPSPPAPQGATTASVPVMMTQQMEQQLRDLGYPQEAIDKLPPEGAWQAINAKQPFQPPDVQFTGNVQPTAPSVTPQPIPPRPPDVAPVELQGAPAPQPVAAILDTEQQLQKARAWYGEDFQPVEPRTPEQQDVVRFVESLGGRGKLKPIFYTSSNPQGQLAFGPEGHVFLSERLTGDLLWSAVGEEVAHASGLDTADVAVQQLVDEAAGKYRAAWQAAPESPARANVLNALTNDPTLARREGVANLVREFMADQGFRKRVLKENPSLWDSIVDAILNVVGTFNPKVQAQQNVLRELRGLRKQRQQQQAKPQQETPKAPVRPQEGGQEGPQVLTPTPPAQTGGAVSSPQAEKPDVRPIPPVSVGEGAGSNVAPPEQAGSGDSATGTPTPEVPSSPAPAREEGSINRGDRVTFKDRETGQTLTGIVEQVQKHTVQVRVKQKGGKPRIAHPFHREVLEVNPPPKWSVGDYAYDTNYGRDNADSIVRITKVNDDGTYDLEHGLWNPRNTGRPRETAELEELDDRQRAAVDDFLAKSKKPAKPKFVGERKQGALPGLEAAAKEAEQRIDDANTIRRNYGRFLETLGDLGGQEFADEHGPLLLEAERKLALLWKSDSDMDWDETVAEVADALEDVLPESDQWASYSPATVKGFVGTQQEVVFEALYNSRDRVEVEAKRQKEKDDVSSRPPAVLGRPADTGGRPPVVSGEAAPGEPAGEVSDEPGGAAPASPVGPKARPAGSKRPGSGRAGQRGDDADGDAASPAASAEPADEAAAGGVQGEDAGVKKPKEDKREKDFRLTEDMVVAEGRSTSVVARIRNNLAAIKLLKKLEAEDRDATPEEQAVLVKYVGWGGLSQAADRRRGKNMEELPEGDYRRDTAWEEKWGKWYKELKTNLTDEEFDTAAASTRNAHYTDLPVFKRMWDAAVRLGFKGGTVLEPAAGVGHFFGLMPEDIAGKSRKVAVELDAISSRITAKLYPSAKVINKPFQESGVPANSVDLAITNVPFAADIIPAGQDLYGQELNLHNFFLAHSLNAVRPGGMVIAITTANTLQAQRQQRQWLSERAELVGAIRLPNTAFKQNAGTEVTTDILFLRKPMSSLRVGGEQWRELLDVESVEGETAAVNEYFVNHPEMVLGQHSMAGKMYAREKDKAEYTVKPDNSRPLNDQIDDAIAKLPVEAFGQATVTQIDFSRRSSSRSRRPTCNCSWRSTWKCATTTCSTFA